jgi:hypothetical protein
MKIEDTYNGMSTFVKEEAGFPDTFISLTREQESFIMDLFDFERDSLKKEILETLEEIQGLVNEL